MKYEICSTIGVKRQAISATALELAKLEAEIEQAANDCQEKDRETELLTRTINRRSMDLDHLSQTVDHIAQLFNQEILPTVELMPRDSTVSTIRVPTFARSDEYRERKKVFVPDELACELSLSFVGRDGNVDCYEDFDEPERLSVPLVNGENLIEVFFDGFRVPNTYTVTNHTNGISIQTVSKHVHGGGKSFNVGQPTNDQENFSLRVGLPKISDAFVGLNSRIVVQMVESTRQ
jgi:hypothetical protein